MQAIGGPEGDPWRIVIASVTGAYTPAQAGALALERGLRVAAYHDARMPAWYEAATIASVVTGIRTATAAHPVPIYLQEPTAWGTRVEDDQTTAHHREAAVRAKAAGAAAWTFHQRLGFTLQERSFQERLLEAGSDQLETALAAFKDALDAQPWGVDATDPMEFYHLDALGSVRAITDRAGTVTGRHDYFAFGDEWNAPATTLAIIYRAADKTILHCVYK